MKEERVIAIWTVPVLLIALTAGAVLSIWAYYGAGVTVKSRETPRGSRLIELDLKKAETVPGIPDWYRDADRGSGQGVTTVAHPLRKVGDRLKRAPDRRGRKREAVPIRVRQKRFH